MQQRTQTRVRRALLTWATALLAGCGSYRAVNPPLPHWDPDYGYRAPEAQAERPIGDLLLVLAFSGGGTRAAALSYGVLQELRETRITRGPGAKSLLDEVDLITSVSGGSFTSAYYGLYGDRIFEDFEPRFLRRNLEAELIRELLRPLNWIRMAGTFFDRSELAVRLYDREIFDGATFANLERAPGPLIQINATDLAGGNRFTFVQPQFDLMCSDLSRLEVARAVAASSAVPGLFTPITLRSYAGTCGFARPPWLTEALQDPSSPRRRRIAEIVARYADGEAKYIHLVDGGVSDNIGGRGPLERVLLPGGLGSRFEQIGNARPKHIAVIVVDAEVHPEPRFSFSPASPSLATMLKAVIRGQIYSYNFETLELLRASLAEWAREIPPDAEGRRVQVYLPEVDFASVQDPEERKLFNALPTSLALSDEQVDRLIAAGRALLRASPEYRRLLAAVD